MTERRGNGKARRRGLPLWPAVTALAAGAAALAVWLHHTAEEEVARWAAAIPRVEAPLPPETLTEPRSPAPSQPASAAAPAEPADAERTAAAPPSPQPATPPERRRAPDPPPEVRAPSPPAGGRDVPVPDPDLLEPGPYGPLPVIGADGRAPWQVYRQDFDPFDPRPRIAIVLNNVSTASADVESAIRLLPSPLALAFSAGSDDLPEWMGLARLAGHEALLSLPMVRESEDGDARPHALLASLTPAQTLDRLEWLLSRGVGYVGVVDARSWAGGPPEASLRPVLAELGARGLMIVEAEADVASDPPDRRPAAAVAADLVIDGARSRDDLEQRLREIEAVAADKGSAVAVLPFHPLTLERLAIWLPTLDEKGFVLAPITAMVEEGKEP